ADRLRVRGTGFEQQDAQRHGRHGQRHDKDPPRERLPPRASSPGPATASERLASLVPGPITCLNPRKLNFSARTAPDVRPGPGAAPPAGENRPENGPSVALNERLWDKGRGNPLPTRPPDRAWRQAAREVPSGAAGPADSPWEGAEGTAGKTLHT